MHLSISLDNDQLDAHLLYFTIRSLQSSTCFEDYMLIIRRLNCIDAATGIVLPVSGRPVHLCTGRPLTEDDDTRCYINIIQPPDDEHGMPETCRGLKWTYCKIKQVCINLVIVWAGESVFTTTEKFVSVFSKPVILFLRGRRLQFTEICDIHLHSTL